MQMLIGLAAMAVSRIQVFVRIAGGTAAYWEKNKRKLESSK